MGTLSRHCGCAPLNRVANKRQMVAMGGVGAERSLHCLLAPVLHVSYIYIHA